RRKDDASAVVGRDRAVERRQQHAVAAHARIVREAHGALDARAGRPPCARGIADTVLTAVGADDDVLSLVAQVEVEEMLEPHLEPGSLLAVGVSPRSANSSGWRRSTAF